MIGMAATIASSGIRIEAGGTAMARMAADISKAVTVGGEKLEEFAKIAGMSAEEFKRAWASDKAQALYAILTGIASHGENAAKVLDNLGWKNVRVAATAGALAKSKEQLREAIAFANTEFARNGALAEKSNIIYDTFNNHLKQTKNLFADMGRTIGSALLPDLRSFLSLIDSGVGTLKSFGAAFPDWLTKGALHGTLSGLTGGLHGVLENLRRIKEEWSNLGPATYLFGGMHGGGKGYGVSGSWDAPGGAGAPPPPGMSEEAEKRLEKFREAVKKLTEELSGGKASEELRVMAAAFQAAGGFAALTGPQIQSLADAVRRLVEEGGKVPSALEGFQHIGQLMGPDMPQGLDMYAGDPVAMANRLAMAKDILAKAGPAKMSPFGFADSLSTQTLINLTNQSKAYSAVLDGLNSKHRTARDTLQQVTNIFQILGVSAHSALGRMVAGFAIAGAAVADLRKNLATVVGDGKGGFMEKLDFKKLFQKDGKFDFSTLTNNLSSMAQIAAAGMSTVKGILEGGGGAKGALGGMMSGAAFGSAFGPWGAAIGGVAGGILGLFGSDPVKKAQEAAGKALGHAVSTEFAKSVMERSKEMGISLGEAAKMLDAEAAAALKKSNWENLASAWKSREAGVSHALGNLGFFDSLALSGEQAGTLFTVNFWAAVETMGLAKAVESMRPAFESMKELMGDQAPLQWLFGEEAADGILKVADGAQQLANNMTGIYNAGYLTVDAFHAYEGAALTAFQQAIDASGSEKESLISIAPLLSNIKRLHEELGIPIDANTQKLIDMAEEMGVVFKPDPVMELVDAIKDLIATISGVPREIHVNTTYTESGNPPVTGGPAQPPGGPDIYASMGFYNPSLPKDTLIQAHTGEEVLITPAGKKKGDVMDVDAMISAMAQAAAGSGGDTIIPITLNMDGKKFAQWITQASRDGRVRIHESALRDF
jgi:hypothetical protein